VWGNGEFGLLKHVCCMSICDHLLSSLAGSAEFKQIVHYELTKSGAFKVLYSRAASNATGAAIGGLIGAGIQAGIESGKDEKKEKQILELINNSDCSPPILNSFIEGLQATPEFTVVAEQPPGDEYLRVELTVDRCGFKLVNSERMFVAPFAEARYRIYHASDGKPKKPKRLLLIGKNRNTWENLLTQPAEVSSSFQLTLSKAGKRLANKVIYHK